MLVVSPLGSSSVKAEGIQSEPLQKRIYYGAFSFPLSGCSTSTEYRVKMSLDSFLSSQGERLLDFDHHGRGYRASWLYLMIIRCLVITCRRLVGKGQRCSFDRKNISIEGKDQDIRLGVCYFSCTDFVWEELSKFLDKINQKLNGFGYDANKDAGMKYILGEMSRVVCNKSLDKTLMKSSCFWNGTMKMDYICKLKQIYTKLPRDCKEECSNCFKGWKEKVQGDKFLNERLKQYCRVQRQQLLPIHFMRYCIEYFDSSDQIRDNGKCSNMQTVEELMDRFELVLGQDIFDMIENSKRLLPPFLPPNLISYLGSLSTATIWEEN